MTWIKLRPALAALTLGLASTGLGSFVSSAQDPAPPPAPATAPPSAGPVRKPAEDAEARLKLRAQEIATARARIAFEQARLKRELAELRLAEYEEVDYPRELATANDNVARDESDLTRARDRMNWSNEMAKKGYVPEGSARSDKLTVERAGFDLNQARTKRDILMKYTHEKQLKSLRAEIEKAQTREKSDESIWKREQAKEEALRPKVSVNVGGKDFTFAIGAFW